MSITAPVAKIAGGFAMVAADNAVHDEDGVMASFNATYGRSLSTEVGLGFKPSTLEA